MAVHGIGQGLGPGELPLAIVVRDETLPAVSELGVERDPIEILGRRLAEEGQLTQADRTAMAEQVESEVGTAIEHAEAAPYLTLEEAGRHVYAD